MSASDPVAPTAPAVERQRMDVDIACVGFGPAMGGFLTTLSRALTNEDGTPVVESAVAPGLPPQIVCYERADDIGFGVSGIATRARSLRASLASDELREIPMSTPIRREKVLYLLDPVGASRRSWLLRLADTLIRLLRWILPYERQALALPYIPPFLRKEPGWILSIGQLNQRIGAKVMGSGLVQIWPGTPVSAPLFEGERVAGVRLIDQGTDKNGKPDAGFMAGMDIHAALTVVGDGPVGAIGRQIDKRFGLPAGRHQRDWAVGMKFVVDLREDSGLETGTVVHTFGFPEPEVFGFLYVHPDRLASLGVFVPSWFDSPVRTAYRYLQHWMLHPYLWRHLEGATLRSWGAKTLAESGRRGEPHLVGHGYARIGEGSGATNVLTGSGVDEAWETGVLLAGGVLDLLKAGRPFTRENLEEVYVRRRRRNRIEHEGRIAAHSRDGFQRGFLRGLFGMALAGFTNGRFAIPGEPLPPHERIPSIDDYFRGRVPVDEIRALRDQCAANGVSLHDALMDRAGWPAIPFDGKLLVSHQDALLMGGKVQAPAGYADHVVFLYPNLCESCGSHVCVELCSGQAITPGPKGVPLFDREKCVHCGACLWNCEQPLPDDPERTNIDFRAGTGGLHSSEN